MSLSSFSTALSGLNANTEGLSVVGNNIANLNTVGFKESDISFSEVLNEQVATGGGSSSVNIGLGTQVQSVSVWRVPSSLLARGNRSLIKVTP